MRRRSTSAPVRSRIEALCNFFFLKTASKNDFGENSIEKNLLNMEASSLSTRNDSANAGTLFASAITTRLQKKKKKKYLERYWVSWINSSFR